MKLLTCFQPAGLLPNPIDIKSEEKEVIKKRIKLLQKKMFYAEQLYLRTREQALDLRKEYIRVDRELARMDGRHKFYEPYKPEPKPKKAEKKMTKEEVFSWARDLSEADKLRLLKALTPPEVNAKNS